MGVYVIDRLLDGRDLFGFLVRNFGFEFLFEGHDQLNRVKRVGAEIIDKGSIVRYLVFFDTELFVNDAAGSNANRLDSYQQLVTADSNAPAPNAVSNPRTKLVGFQRRAVSAPSASDTAENTPRRKALNSTG